MTGGHECPLCGERVLPFGQGCACPLPGERCPRCDGYVDGGMPECGCLPDYDEPDEPSPWTPEPDIDALERERDWE